MRLEAEQSRESLDMLRVAMEFKQGAQEEIKRAREQGLPVPDILPHPEDILIDEITGIVAFTGPMFEEQRTPYLAVLEIRNEYREMAEEAMQKFVASDGDASMEEAWQSWSAAIASYNRINDRLPPSLKKPYQGRCQSKIAG